MNHQLILASSSVYRKQLLHKLGLPFICISPDIDETPHSNESAQELVLRLAREKAVAITKQHRITDAIIIASDQVAVIDGVIIGKPLNKENAIKQLEKASGKKITFYTSLCVFNSKTNFNICDFEPFDVYFKQLSYEEINFYVESEEPFYCAGSFKSEGLGICLFEKLQGRDPNTLIGMPLILLTEMLNKHGINILSKSPTISD